MAASVDLICYIYIEKIIKEKEKPLPTASESSDSSMLDMRCSSLIWSAEN